MRQNNVGLVGKCHRRNTLLHVHTVVRHSQRNGRNDMDNIARRGRGVVGSIRACAGSHDCSSAETAGETQRTTVLDTNSASAMTVDSLNQQTNSDESIMCCPVIQTTVPPDTGPDVGSMCVTTASCRYSYVSDSASVGMTGLLGLAASKPSSPSPSRNATRLERTSSRTLTAYAAAADRPETDDDNGGGAEHLTLSDAEQDMPNKIITR